MNQIETIQLLDTLSVPSFYGQAPTGTKLPFIAIHTTEPDNFAADNRVYCEKWNFRIDLYSTDKRLDLETEIKTLLNENGIYWTKSEQYIDSQSCWEVEFDFDVMGNEAIPVPPDEEGDSDGS